MNSQNGKYSKRTMFLISLILDIIGMISYVFPPIDIIWAPLSAFLMLKLYKGTVGKIGGIVSFIEEAIPGLDFFPSFTLTWLYVYVLKKDKVIL